MTVIDNQEHLIAQTQLLYDELFNAGKYAEAIAIGKLILDLSTAFKELVIARPTTPLREQVPTISPYSEIPFGQANFAAINQAIRQVTTPVLQVRTELYKNNQFDQPPQQSQYAWADGFQGVTVPPREIDALPLPNPNNISSQPKPDYWEDARRQ